MIGQKAALMMANMLLGTILGLVAAILIGRFFDPFHAGQFNYALSIGALFFIITDLGMGSAHVKRVSEGRNAGDCFATYAVFKLVATMVFVTLVGAGVWIYHGYLGKPLEDTTLPIILVVVAYYVTRALADVGQSSFDARLETAKSQVAQLTDTLVRVGLTALFAITMAAMAHRLGWALALVPEGAPWLAWVRDEPGLALAIATLAGSLAAMAVSVTLLFRTLEWGRFRWDLLKDYSAFALPLFISHSISLLAINIDGAMLGFFRGAADVGVFSQVRRLPLVLAGLGGAVSALLLPAVSGMLARGDKVGVQRTADGALRYLSLLLVPAVAFTVAFPYDLIRLTLGENWLGGAPALALLSIGVLIATFGHAHSFLLLGHGRSGISAKVGVGSAIVLIVLDIILIPDDIRAIGLPLAGWGVTGAAIATLAANLVWYVGTRYYSRTIAGYTEPNHLWYHVAGALVMVVALLALDATVFPLVRWYHFIAYVAIGGALYFAALFAMRAVDREDIDFVRTTLHPGEMLRYIRGEMRSRRQ